MLGTSLIWRLVLLLTVGLSMVESDAKACIDALKAPFDEVPWRISSITVDTLLWAFYG